MASIIGIAQAETTARTTVYDPTCGSGSLLLKVGEAAPTKVALYGQEKDVATQGLARMNMVLHGYATAEIEGGNTLTTPLFKNGEALQTFDYVVANPLFPTRTGAQASYRTMTPMAVSHWVFHRRRTAITLLAAYSGFAQAHGQRGVHSSAWGALSRQCRGRHPPSPVTARLY